MNQLTTDTDRKNSYDQVLKSTSIMGGAAGVNMLLGLLRVKFAAVLIGTVGVGMIANFTSIHSMISAVAGLGLHASAVRDIVAAHATGDQQALARIRTVTIKMCLITGLVGLVVMTLFSKRLSIWTFGNANYSSHIALLGFAILWGNLAGGYQAVIQGIRRIDYLAKINIASAVISTMAAISLYSLFGVDGIVPSILLTSLAGLCISWFFSRKLNLVHVEVSWSESFEKAGTMIRLGSALMTAGVITLLGKYITNALLTNQINLEAIGVYSAAFALSAVMVDFVLNAMNADYFPRLISTSSQKDVMGDLVSEQIEIGLLIVTPGLILTLTFSPWIVEFFYAKEFLPAVELLQWFVIAGMASVLSRPTGQIMIALGKSNLFLLITIALQGIYILFLIWALALYGLLGSAMAWVLLRLIHVLIMMFFARNLISFSMPNETEKLVIRCALPVVVLFIISSILPSWLVACIGSALLVFSCRYNLLSLRDRLGREHRIVSSLRKFVILRTLLK